jgi:sugar/nucleoside kinase (ribokinase family)
MYEDVKYPVETSQTIDVSGAGDTFLASLAYYYRVSNTIKDSIDFANQMASKVVTKRGVSII